MKNKKSSFSEATEKLNKVQTKIGISNSQLQTYKEKIRTWSQKLQNLKQKSPSNYYLNKNDYIMKKNKSNDCISRNQPVYLSTLQKAQQAKRISSDVKTRLKMYKSSIQQPNHKKSNSQPNQFNESSPKNQYQSRLPYYRHEESSSDQPYTKQRNLSVQHFNQIPRVLSPKYIAYFAIQQKSEQVTIKAKARNYAISQILFNLKRRKFKRLQIDDFKLIHFIEQGQFGSVHFAKHIATNFLCALKKIPKNIFEGDPNNIKQLIRQVKIQTFLNHANIARLYTCFDDSEHVYLMMQYCNGGNLYAALKKQTRFEEQKVKRYIKQVCQAVDYMHNHDIIHRDIKPQNILLQRDTVKLCDFGWSINSPLPRATQCGTPLYSSPQIIERKQYDSKVDIWNIGILTHQLLFGKIPFQIKCHDDLYKIVQEDIQISKNARISPAAEDFILNCLKKDPKQRPPMIKLIDHQFINQ